MVTEPKDSASSKTKASLSSSLLPMLFLNHYSSESLSAGTRHTDLLSALCTQPRSSEGITFAHYRDRSEKATFCTARLKCSEILRSAHTLYLCVVYGSHYKERLLFLYNRDGMCLLRGTNNNSVYIQSLNDYYSTIPQNYNMWK